LVAGSLVICVANLGSIFLVQTMLGFGFALYCASLFGSIPFLVDARVLGTAFGIRAVSENIGLFVTPIFIGEILSRTKTGETQDYTMALGALIAIAIVGVSFGVWIYADDLKNRGGVLESTDRLRLLIELVETPVPGRELPMIMISHLSSSEFEDRSYAAQGTLESQSERLSVYSECSSARIALKRNLLRRSMVR